MPRDLSCQPNGGDITTVLPAGSTILRVVNFNGNGATIDTNGNSITFANAFGGQNGIGGNGGLTKIGAGTLTLDNLYATDTTNQSNSYTGPTTISGGTLAIGPHALIVNGGAANQIATAGTNRRMTPPSASPAMPLPTWSLTAAPCNTGVRRPPPTASSR